MLLNQPIRQIAYCVKDARKAAISHSQTFGSGPFFVLDLPESDVVYRGEKTSLDQTAIIGQWGKIQVELIQDHLGTPSIFNELYPKDQNRTGIHHVAIFVENIEAAVSELGKAGFPEVMRLTPKGTDIVAVFLDAVSTLGHYIELYEPRKPILDVYDFVEQAAIGFDGTDPLRNLKF